MDTLWTTLADQGPLVALLLMFLYGFYKEWWVMGKQVARERAEKEEWKRLASQGTRYAEETLDVVNRAMSRGGGGHAAP